MIQRLIRKQIIKYLRKNHGAFELDGLHVALMSKKGFTFFRENVNAYLNSERG